MVMSQPETDPFRMVNERIAMATVGQTLGGHPILETATPAIITIGTRVNHRATPPERQVSISDSPRTTRPA